MPRPTQVLLFVPCLVDSFYPETAEAVVRIFEGLGLDVVCPERQTCCGQPAFNAGYRKEARVAARRFIDIFQGDIPIVSPSGSCVYMVKHAYPELLAKEPRWAARAQRIAQRIFEFTEFLVDVLGVCDLGATYHGRITYHDSCHLARGLGIRSQPRELLKHLRGAELVEMKDADRCCGFGGAFSFKYPDISAALVQDKVDNILASHADTVAGCDVSCLMNIQGRLNRQGAVVNVKHIAELLAPP